MDVPAEQTWFEPLRPLGGVTETGSAQADADTMLDIQDVAGRRWIDTELKGRIVVAEENASAALEVMSRFALAPQWLAYLPPTMSPSETSGAAEWLERPEEALAYFRNLGVKEVICEEKHMGSRAVIALCRDAETARARFAATAEETGAVWTRTGRAFFNDPARTEGLLARLRSAVGGAGLWSELETDWLLLDAEIMPWSAKASSLIDSQYAPVAASSRAGFAAAADAFARAQAHGADVAGIKDRFADRSARAALYGEAWAPYVWPVSGVDDLKVAPFHLLASEGRVWFDQDHVWHMTLADRLTAAGDGVVTRTQWRTCALGDAGRMRRGGFLVGSADGQGRRRHGGQTARVRRPWQEGPDPAGFEGARPRICGSSTVPNTTPPDNLSRLRERGLNGKRNLALREFALGHEGLKRFVAREPLRRVHECVFAVLALESEPIDPRL